MDIQTQLPPKPCQAILRLITLPIDILIEYDFYVCSPGEPPLILHPPTHIPKHTQAPTLLPILRVYDDLDNIVVRWRRVVLVSFAKVEVSQTHCADSEGQSGELKPAARKDLVES